MLRNYVVEVQSKGPLLVVKKFLKCVDVGHPLCHSNTKDSRESRVLICRTKIIKREGKGSSSKCIGRRIKESKQ